MLILALCIALLNVNAIYAQSNDTEVQDIQTDMENIGNYNEELEDAAINQESQETTLSQSSEEVTDEDGPKEMADSASSKETDNSDDCTDTTDNSDKTSKTSEEEKTEYSAAGGESSSNPSGAIYVRADGMSSVNFAQLKEAGVTDIFLNYHAFRSSQYTNALNKFLQDSQDNGIRVSVWVQAFYKDGQWIDRTNEQNKNEFLIEIENYLADDRIGGVHLDYIRYPGTASNRAGAEGTESITNFVAQVYQHVKAINPNALVSAALMPEGVANAEYYGQDYSKLAEHLDVLVPMIYRGNYKQTVDWVATATRYIVDQANGTPVWVAVLSYYSDGNLARLPTGLLLADIEAALGNGASGYAIFRHGLIEESFYNVMAGKEAAADVTYSLKQITDAARRLKSFVDNNQRLPNTLEITNGYYLSMSEFLYLMSQATVQLNTGNNANIALKRIAPASDPMGDNLTENLDKTEYQHLAQKVIDFMDKNQQAPNFGRVDEGKLKYESMVYTYSKILDFHDRNQRLPNFVTLNDTNDVAAARGVNNSYPINNPPSSDNGNNTPPQNDDSQDDDNGDESSNDNPTSFSPSSIKEAASRVNSFINENQRLPQYVTINGSQIAIYDFMYLMSQASIQLNTGNQSQINPKDIGSAPNSSGTIRTGDLVRADYLDLAQRLVSYMDNHGRIPNFATVPQGTISSEGLVSVFARILNFHNQNNRLPNFISLTNSVNQIQPATTGSQPAPNPEPDEPDEPEPGNPGVKFTLSQIQDAANRVLSFTQSNKRLPNFVTINNQQVAMSDFLHLLSKEIVQSNTGDSTNIPHKEVNPANGPIGDKLSGSLTKTEYVEIAQRVLSFIEDNGLAPNFASSSRGRIRYESLIYMFAKIARHQHQNSGVLPNSVSLDDDFLKNVVVDTTYLSATRNCQVNHSSIVNLANSLISGKNSTWSQAEAIFNWVRYQVGYSFYYNTRHGAVGTLSTRSGNCVDQAHVLIALSRAAGIPARYVHGNCTFSSGARYGHVWGELLIDGRWVIADPSSVRNSLGVINSWNRNTATIHNRYAELPF